MVTRKEDVGWAFGGGIIAGIVGGAVDSAALLISSVMKHHDTWLVLKGAAAPFIGQRAMRPGFDPFAVFTGLAAHFTVSMIWGVLFALLVFGLSRGSTILAGVLWGFVVWIGMFYVVLPLVGLGAMPKQVPVGAAIFQHVIFGLAVAAGFLPFQRRQPFSQRRVTARNAA
jgi:hypothetical protein